MKWKHIWRHFKRFWFENDYRKNSILTRRAKRLEFYEFRRKFKNICEQTNLDEKYYKWFYDVEINDEDYNVFGKIFWFFRDQKLQLPMDDFLLNKHKLVCLHRITGVTSDTLIGNHFIYYTEFYELWCLWKDAPFWKDYSVWKKIHNMLDDF